MVGIITAMAIIAIMAIVIIDIMIIMAIIIMADTVMVMDIIIVERVQVSIILARVEIKTGAEIIPKSVHDGVRNIPTDATSIMGDILLLAPNMKIKGPRCDRSLWWTSCVRIGTTYMPALLTGLMP